MAKKTVNLPSKKDTENNVSNKEYNETLASLKNEIGQAQIKAVAAVNKGLLHLYWKIGSTLVDKQKKSGCGTSVIEKLAKDIQNAFPEIEGFSRANIFRMKAFFVAYEKVAQAVRLFESLPIFDIPWGHSEIMVLVCMLTSIKGVRLPTIHSGLAESLVN